MRDPRVDPRPGDVVHGPERPVAWRREILLRDRRGVIYHVIGLPGFVRLSLRDWQWGFRGGRVLHVAGEG